MRLWLGAAFAGVSLIAAASVYVFVDDSRAAPCRASPPTWRSARPPASPTDLGKVDKLHAANVLVLADTGNFEAWALNRHGNAFAPGQNLAGLARRAREVGGASSRHSTTAATGRACPATVTVAAAPIFGNRDVPVRGAVIVRADPPPALTRAFDQLRGDRLTAALLSRSRSAWWSAS